MVQVLENTKNILPYILSGNKKLQISPKTFLTLGNYVPYNDQKFYSTNSGSNYRKVRKSNNIFSYLLRYYTG